MGCSTCVRKIFFIYIFLFGFLLSETCLRPPRDLTGFLLAFYSLVLCIYSIYVVLNTVRDIYYRRKAGVGVYIHIYPSRYCKCLVLSLSSEFLFILGYFFSSRLFCFIGWVTFDKIWKKLFYFHSEETRLVLLLQNPLMINPFQTNYVDY